MLPSIPKEQKSSAQAENVIKRIEEGKLPDKNINWDNLSSYDRDEILKIAEKFVNQTAGHRKLSTLHNFCQKQDLWAGTQVLGMFARSQAEEKQKIKAIGLIDENLNEIRTSLKKDASDKRVSKYHHFLADSHSLAGIVMSNNDPKKAITRFSLAIIEYEKSGLNERAEAVKVRIELLNKKSDGYSDNLITLEDLADRKTQYHQINQKIAQAKKEIEELSESYLDKRKEKEHISARIQEIKKENAFLQQEVEKKERELDDFEVVVDFFQAFIQHSITPLWVEAVRLSLIENQIDDNFLWAVKKISETYPEKALPLMVEISARTDNKFDFFEKFTDLLSENWMNLIIQAREILDDEPEKAGELLVQAWDVYFKQKGA